MCGWIHLNQVPLLLVLLPFIVFGTLSQIFTDDSHINDQDLVLSPVGILQESDNAHYSLPKIENLSTQQQQSYESALTLASEMKTKNFNNQEAIDLVNQTKNFTDDFIVASNKRGYQCPTLINDYSVDATLCNLKDIREAMGIIKSAKGNIRFSYKGGGSYNLIVTSEDYKSCRPYGSI